MDSLSVDTFRLAHSVMACETGDTNGYMSEIKAAGARVSMADWIEACEKVKQKNGAKVQSPNANLNPHPDPHPNPSVS